MSTINTYSTQPCLTQEQLQAYCSNKMPQAQVRNTEEHLSNCELCSDAIDGLLALPSTDAGKLLNNQFSKIEKSKKIIPIQFYKTWKIAASILVLLGVGLGVVQYFTTEKNKEVALVSKQQKENLPENNTQNNSPINKDTIVANRATTNSTTAITTTDVEKTEKQKTVFIPPVLKDEQPPLPEEKNATQVPEMHETAMDVKGGTYNIAEKEIALPLPPPMAKPAEPKNNDVLAKVQNQKVPAIAKQEAKKATDIYPAPVANQNTDYTTNYYNKKDKSPVTIGGGRNNNTEVIVDGTLVRNEEASKKVISASKRKKLEIEQTPNGIIQKNYTDLIAEKQYEAALIRLNSLLSKDPSNTDWVYNKAICLYNVNKKEEAILLLQNTLNKAPKNWKKTIQLTLDEWTNK